MALIDPAEITALTNTSSPEAFQRVLDMMLAEAHEMATEHLPGGSPTANAGRTQAMPIHMRQQRALSVVTLTPSTNPTGTTDFTIEGGSPICAFTHPAGVPPMTIVAASVFVPTTGPAGANAVGTGLWLQLWLHGAPITRPLEITAVETAFQFDAFEVTLDEGSVFELRGNVNFTTSAYIMDPLHLHLWCLMPTVRGPLQQA